MIARSDELRAQQKRQGKNREQVDMEAVHALKGELRTITEKVHALQVKSVTIYGREYPPR